MQPSALEPFKAFPDQPDDCGLVTCLCQLFPFFADSHFISIIGEIWNKTNNNKKNLHTNLLVYIRYSSICHLLEHWDHGFCCCSVAQSFLTLCHPLDCSAPGFSVHGILQARILQWVAISFSRGFFWLRDRTHVSCIADRFFITEPPGKQPANMKTTLKSLPLAASHHDFVAQHLKSCCSNFLPFLSLPFSLADSWSLWEEIKSEIEHLLRNSFQDCDLVRLQNSKKKKKIQLTLIMYFI